MRTVWLRFDLALTVPALPAPWRRVEGELGAARALAALRGPASSRLGACFELLGGRPPLGRAPNDREMLAFVEAALRRPGSGASVWEQPATVGGGARRATATPGGPAGAARPRVVAIAWLEGGNERGDVTQWVNLPAEQRFVDAARGHVGGLAHADRLGREPRFRVRFDRPGAHAVRIWVEAAAGNAVYSSDELGREPAFAARLDDVSATTGADGTATLRSFRLSPAGLDRFRLHAIDDQGGEVTSGWLTTRRLLWIVSIHMEGLPPPPLLPDRYASIGVDFVILEGDRHIPYAPNVFREMPPRQSPIGANAYSEDRLEHEVSGVARRTAGHLAPYAFGYATIDRAVDAVVLELPATPVQTPTTTLELSRLLSPGRPVRAYLWRDLNAAAPGAPGAPAVGPEHDRDRWFVGGTFTPTGGRPSPLDPSRVTAAEAAGDPPRSASRVQVDTRGLGPGTVLLTVRVCGANRCGASWPRSPAAFVAQRSGVRPNSVAHVVSHELGHKLGLSPGGREDSNRTPGSSLDAGPTHYVASGVHCHTGTPPPGPDLGFRLFTADHWRAALRYPGAVAPSSMPTCFMFGLDLPQNPPGLCADCTARARKVTLDGGFGRHASS